MHAITLIDDHDDGLRLTCRGEIDLTTAPALERSVLTALDASRTRLVLDATQVTFLDSSGLRTLMVIAARCEEAGIEFDLRASDPVRLVFGALGVPLPGSPAPSADVRRRA
jgi:anti-anti-sigma factor